MTSEKFCYELRLKIKSVVLVSISAGSVLTVLTASASDQCVIGSSESNHTLTKDICLEMLFFTNYAPNYQKMPFCLPLNEKCFCFEKMPFLWKTAVRNAFCPPWWRLCSTGLFITRGSFFTATLKVALSDIWPAFYARTHKNHINLGQNCSHFFHR